MFQLQTTGWLTSGRGRKVTSLGVLYDFTGNDRNTTVQKVEEMVKEAWVCHNALVIVDAAQ